jgi:drug/metabolite transporter (DMT)-like permease
VSNAQLFTACVAIWGSTWIAITYQLGHVSPEASVSYRFLLASVLLFAYCRMRRLPLAFSRQQHAWIALQGFLMFSVSYIFVYYAEQNVVSGLVAVGYSASPLLAMLGLRAFFGTPMTPRIALGSVMGIVGIALVFYPELAHLQGGGRAALGAIFTALSVVVASLGSLVAHRNHEADLPLWQTMAWGMFYGAGLSLVVTFGVGQTLAFEATLPYVLSLLYLAILGSIVAFAGYLTLMRRVGAARSGYIGVMVPIVALLLSSLLEHFDWHALTFAGIAVSVAGNVVILRERQ